MPQAKTGKAEVSAADAPGLVWRSRQSGQRISYWIASRAAVDAGYPIKTVRLIDTWSADQIAAACRKNQAEMLEWLAHNGDVRPVVINNTWGGLISAYERNPTSRFNIPFEEGGLKFNTRNQYAEWNVQIYKVIANRTLDGTRAEDFRNWHNLFATPRYEGDPPAYPKAKACMSQINRLLQFGVMAEIDGCERLAKILNGVGHHNSKPIKFKGGEARTEELTLEHVIKFCEECHKPENAPYHAGLALATVLQFETTLRQADVIGQWWPVENAADGSLVNKGERWVGLTWGEHIDADLVLAKPTSKSRGVKITLADLTMSPLVMAELECIPREKRVGPVVISGYTGLPYKRKAFGRAWRQIANKAGIPAEVQNRDARAGAITEALDHGANAEHVRAQATHAETPSGRRMTTRYDRVKLEKARSVQAARLAGRR